MVVEGKLHTGGHLCFLRVTQGSTDEDVTQWHHGNRLTRTGHVNHLLIVCHVWRVKHTGEKCDQDMMKMSLTLEPD